MSGADKTKFRAEFVKRWVEPILRACPKQVKLKDFLELVFCVNSRIISYYRANHAFVMSGVWLLDGVFPVQGSANEPTRNVRKNDILIVRVDDTAPNQIDVDFQGNVFRCNRYEWDHRVVKHVRLAHGQEQI